MENLLLEEELKEIERKEEFQVNDLEQANWCFRKLKAIEKKEQEVKSLVDGELARIKTWEEKELKKYEEDKNYFEFLLNEYYKRQKEVDPKFKVSTPYGKISSRKQQPKFIQNDEELLNWLKDREMFDFIKITEKAQWGELKKTVVVKDNIVVTEDGEVVEGIVVEPVEDSVSIKLVD